MSSEQEDESPLPTAHHPLPTIDEPPLVALFRHVKAARDLMRDKEVQWELQQLGEEWHGFAGDVGVISNATHLVALRRAKQARGTNGNPG